MQGYELFFRNYVQPKVYKDLLEKTFGVDWLGWEPETVLQEIYRVFSVNPPSLIRDKIFATQTFLNTDLFWEDVMAFEDIILAFGDRHVDPDLVQVCLPGELAYGVIVAEALKKKKDFVSDITSYVRACHIEAGVLVYHPVLKFAQPKYPDEFRKGIVAAVEKRIADGAAVSEIDHENPVEVQLAKALDVNEYVQERLARGEGVE